MSRFERLSRAVIESPWFAGIGALITLYCLFGGDILVACIQEDTSFVRDIMTIVALVFFAVELLLTLVAQPSFFLSFFFFLDFICLVTLVLDISWVGAGLLSGAASKASRASRAGTRATRAIRIIRLVRLFRVSKMFKAFLTERSIRSDDNQVDEMDESEEIPLVHGRETELGKRLSHRTSQRVIIVVLLLMFVIPQLDANAHSSPTPDIIETGFESSVRNYMRFVEACKTEGQSAARNSSRELYERNLISFLLLACNGLTDCGSGRGSKIMWIGAAVRNQSDPCAKDLNAPGPIRGRSRDIGGPLVSRLSQPWDNNCNPEELSTFGVSLSNDVSCPFDLPGDQIAVLTSQSSDADPVVFEIVLDKRDYTRSEALLSIYRTLAICVILSLGIYMFSQGAFVIVLEPIERMLAKVDRIRENPLLATKLDNDSIKKSEQERLKRIARFNTATNPISRWVAKRRLAELSQSSLETNTLEKTIMRIGGLLAVGFGQAGAEIVAHNMSSSSTGINAMVPGRRIDAIFACVHVCDFVQISALLKDKIMLFVNQVSEIVHGIMDEFHGMPNKTSGDTFLIVWRLTGDSIKDRKLHDMAITACLKVEVAIRRSLAMYDYRRIPALTHQLKRDRIALTFGLHRGWAIEGAIGSNLKIDPTYLGPDVNVAESIGAFNSEYDTTFLASESVVESSSVKEWFRCIDCIKLRSMGNALNIFVLDIDPQAELLSSYEIEHGLLTTATHLTKHRQRRERARRRDHRWTTDLQAFMKNDPFIMKLRDTKDPTIIAQFGKGFLNYQAGEWTTALESLSLCAEIDGPSRNLIEFMRTHSNEPPSGWNGVRNHD